MIFGLAQAGLVIVSAWSGHWSVVGFAAALAFALTWHLGTARHSADLRRVTQADRSAAAEGAALSRETLIRGSIDAVDVPIFSIGPDGLVLVANRSAGDFFAESLDEPIVGRPAEGLFESLDAIRVIRAAGVGQAGVAEVSMLRGETRRTIRVSATPGGGEVRAVVTLRDVTEEARAHRLTTDFVANASHELRTPLAAIKGAAETLSVLTPGDEPMHARLCEMIADNSKRIEDLTGDLLDLSRLESPERPPRLIDLDLDAVARGVVEHFSALSAERRVTIRTEVSADAARGRSDPRLLGLILRNLVDNAVKYSSPDSDVLVACSRGGAGITWRVSDQGVGIPLEEQPRIFERFYRVDQARAGSISGSGLGLALVNQAVVALGGKIRVESVWSKGTTMIVELPDHPSGS